MNNLEINGDNDSRLQYHPILNINDKIRSKKTIKFTFNGKEFNAKADEMIASALFANNIHIFGHHERDNAPQGIFCANGQCSQCLVLANGKPVKSCVVPIQEGIKIESIDNLPELNPDDNKVNFNKTQEISTQILIIGAGPAGLTAALELAPLGFDIIIIDDKQELGGKLSLQTHNFFGSISDCYAGTRGIDIGIKLADEISKFPNIQIWLDSPAVGVFVDKKVGVVRHGVYCNIIPEILLVATGAREKNLIFPGADLPNVYGAGAFQTIVNRDLVKPSDRLFIVGGGNVGLIGAYHAIQAGIKVVGLIEAMPKCGGYKVHEDKIKRLGVPIFTSHTILRAEGDGKVERVVIAECDCDFKVKPGSEKVFEVDTVLIAVGLSPVNEMYEQAKKYGFTVFGAGDASVIAEASAAIFSGKITAREMIQHYVLDDNNPREKRIELIEKLKSDIAVPKQWTKFLEILRSKPGPVHEYVPDDPKENLVYPVIRCIEEIPCNPCTEVCPNDAIKILDDSITGLPEFVGECVGCGKCVAICPGLAITLVNKKKYDPEGKKALITIPWEIDINAEDDNFIPVIQEIIKGAVVTTTGLEGNIVGKGIIQAWKKDKWQNHRVLMFVEVPADEADQVAGIIYRPMYEDYTPEFTKLTDVKSLSELDDDTIICRCERITKKEIMDEIAKGARDFNQLKAVLRVGMGACGSKTCTELIARLFREAGVKDDEFEKHVKRPFELEVPLDAFLDDNSK